MAFKVCPKCEAQWETREDLLRDPAVRLVAYQPSFVDLRAGLYLFNHNCRTTLAVPVKLFWDLLPDPMYPDRLTGTKECPGHCLQPNSLAPCNCQCECVCARSILQILKEWKKDKPSENSRRKALKAAEE